MVISDGNVNLRTTVPLILQFVFTEMVYVVYAPVTEEPGVTMKLFIFENVFI
jgi:hypothetical protein